MLGSLGLNQQLCTEGLPSYRLLHTEERLQWQSCSYRVQWQGCNFSEVWLNLRFEDVVYGLVMLVCVCACMGVSNSFVPLQCGTWEEGLVHQPDTNGM